MTVLIGYVPTPIGEAARGRPRRGRRRNEDAVILNSPRRGSTVDGHLVDDQAGADLVERARRAGVTAAVDHADHGADIVDTFEAVIERTGVGSSSSGSAAAPGRQARDGQRRPAAPAGARRPRPRRQARRRTPMTSASLISRVDVTPVAFRDPPCSTSSACTSLGPARDRRGPHRLQHRPGRDLRRRGAPRAAARRRRGPARPGPVAT